MAALALGKLSALREIEWVREASRRCPTLGYYYMGYYIHECPKMRYKAEYAPSELKCPVTGQWVDFRAKCAPWLDTRKFAPLGLPMDETTVRTGARADVTDERIRTRRRTARIVDGRRRRGERASEGGDVRRSRRAASRVGAKVSQAEDCRVATRRGRGWRGALVRREPRPDRSRPRRRHGRGRKRRGIRSVQSDGEDADQEEKSL